MIDRRAVALGLGAGAIAAAAPPDRLSLGGDIDILEHAFKAMHPGLYRYATPAEVDARFKALRAELSGGTDLSAAFLALSRFTATVRCGHTFLNPVNQKKATAHALFGAKTGVPFLFVWRNGAMVVTRALEGGPAPGAQVTRLNGVATGDMLRRMLPLSRADGSVDAKRIANLELTGEDRIAAFDAFLPRIAPAPAGTVVVELSDGRRLELAAIAPSERKALFAGVAEAGDPPWSLKLEGGVGVLRMPTWALFDKAPKWPAWLDAAFDRLVEEKARGLVIDLRGNEGGADVGLAILARLVDREVHLPAYRRYVRYRSAPQDLLPYLDTWDPSFREWGTSAVGPDSEGYYRLNRFDDDETGRDVVRPAGKRFTAPVAVLVGPENSSATFQFALAVRTLGAGKLVGRTTGGNLRGINGGAFFFLRLPTSGLEVDLPLIAYRPDTPEPDAGLEPDIRAVESAADIADGRDVQTERALRAIA